MARAIWNDTVIAESDNTVMVEGNHYFPPSDINFDHLSPTTSTSVCPWKGTAEYFTIVVDGAENRDAAWTYRSPSDAAAAIKDHVAFWNGVQVEA